MNLKHPLFLAVSLVAIVGGALFGLSYMDTLGADDATNSTSEVKTEEDLGDLVAERQSDNVKMNQSDETRNSDTTENTENLQDRFVNHDVPFASQAPYGDWADPIHQYACEESSALMAMGWVRGESYSLGEIDSAVTEISNFEEENYGTFYDTSSRDTIDRIFLDYFDYDNVELRTEVSVDSLKQALFQDNLVLVPANGRILRNPHYTAPGPLRHMLLIKGYDPEAEEFITHDPGTRFGENFRYSEDIMVAAIQDYPTGHDLPITESRKNMIVVSR